MWSSVASKTSHVDGEINPRDTGLSRDVMLLSILVPHLRALTSRPGSEEWLRLTRPIAGLLGSAEEGLSSGGEGCCTRQSMDSTRRRLRLCQPSAHPAWKTLLHPKNSVRSVRCPESQAPGIPSSGNVALGIPSDRPTLLALQHLGCSSSSSQHQPSPTAPLDQK